MTRIDWQCTASDTSSAEAAFVGHHHTAIARSQLFRAIASLFCKHSFRSHLLFRTVIPFGQTLQTLYVHAVWQYPQVHQDNCATISDLHDHHLHSIVPSRDHFDTLNKRPRSDPVEAGRCSTAILSLCAFSAPPLFRTLAGIAHNGRRVSPDHHVARPLPGSSAHLLTCLLAVASAAHLVSRLRVERQDTAKR